MPCAWDPGHNRGYTPHPDNYNRLISVALELEEAVFITLNYDTLLDRRLFAYSPLTSMDSYTDAGKNWALIKLHGSVDWGRQVANEWEIPDSDPYLATTFAGFGDHLTVHGDVTLRLNADLRLVRQEGQSSQSGGRLFYPALSAPLGPGDELVCPPITQLTYATVSRRTAGGSAKQYLCTEMLRAEIQAMQETVELVAAFSDALPIALLGRGDFFAAFRVGFDERSQTFRLEKYSGSP